MTIRCVEYKDTSNLVAVGKATPIGDVLSIRPYESDDAEALIKMPKESYVGILYFDGDWMYVKYYRCFRSTGAFSPDNSTCIFFRIQQTIPLSYPKNSETEKDSVYAQSRRSI
jgi:hypothetical protein